MEIKMHHLGLTPGWFVLDSWLVIDSCMLLAWNGKIKRVTYHMNIFYMYTCTLHVHLYFDVLFFPAKLANDWSPCCKYSTLDSFPSYLFRGICGRISLTFRVICRRLFVRVGGIDHGHQSHAQIHSEKIHHTKTRTGQSC